MTQTLHNGSIQDVPYGTVPQSVVMQQPCREQLKNRWMHLHHTPLQCSINYSATLFGFSVCIKELAFNLEIVLWVTCF